ncbi:MAG: MASE1 domain-containing protein [Myxococcaceae bacterium]|nr:MASE1 domain-containing protein [Myxococcaceae bacterium]
MPRLPTARALPGWGLAGLLALVYYGLEWVTDVLWFVEPLPWGVFWPAAGFYQAVLLRRPRHAWPSILIAFSVAEVADSLRLGEPALVILGGVVGGALEPVLGALLVQRFVRGPVTLLSVRQVLVLVTFAAVLSPLVAGALGAALTTPFLPGGFSFTRIWMHWWLGDVLGVTVVTPFCLAALPVRRLRPVQRAEMAALLVAVVAAILWIFSGTLPEVLWLPVPYATVLLLVWAALRLGVPGVSTATVVMSALAGWLVSRGQAPFIAMEVTQEGRILAVQAFLMVASISGLLLAAALEERRRAEQHQRLLALTGTVLADARDEVEGLREVTRLLVPSLADGCAVVLPRSDEEKGSPIVTCAHVRREREALLASALPVSLPSPAPSAGLLLREVTPKQRRSLGGEGATGAALRALAPTSLLVLPVQNGLAAPGQLVLLQDVSARHFDASDVELATEVARRCAMAVERARLMRQTQEAVRMRDDFLAIASHELKSPLTPLSLHLQALKRAAETRRPVDAAAVEKARTALRRLVSLINDLLDASRVGTGKLVLSLAATPLHEVACDVAGSFEGTSPRHRVVVEIADEDAWVWGDRARLEQVLINLLENAIKYSPEGGEVRVRLDTNGDEVHLAVSDQGIGIPQDQQAHLFERFFRASNVTERALTGLGLGLYICRTIVEHHGGRIWVESCAGKGSTFHVSLPRLSAAERLHREPTVEASPPA